MAKTDYITNGREKKERKEGVRVGREGKRRGVEERKRMEEEWKRERARGDRKKRQLKGKG